MKLLFTRAGVVLLAFTVSLVALGAVLGVARANHPTHDPKPGWYVPGGANADRVLSEGEGHLATWWYTRLYKNYSWRAYWIVRNVSSKPITVGCAGYKNYGLDGYKAAVFYHQNHNYTWSAFDAKCVHLGKDYTQTLQPGEYTTSWAHFKYAGKKGTCTKLTLPTGPNVPPHKPYTKCVDPYGKYLGPDPEDKGYRLPFVGEYDITQGPQCNETHNRYGGYPASKEAIDFAMKKQVVYAARGGEITMADWDKTGFGYMIIIKHDSDPNNLEYSRYAHLSKFIKTSGHVDQGDPIAISGDTGGEKNTGYHLHFEVRDSNGNAVYIREIPGITWKSGDPSKPCQYGKPVDGVAIGPPV